VIPDPVSTHASPTTPVSEYRLRRRVQFSDVDSARIVHFSQYFRYMEEAEHALWRAAGLSIAPRGATLGYARLGASFDYHSPLRFEDEFDILIRITKITTRTMRYECLVTRGDDRIATGGLTIVCVTGDDSHLRSIPIPPDTAARFAAVAGSAT
jgi:YbgC/YbaW family acyl-CoA thioester hydrolase